jgi:N-acetylmuramoyl-L-alanine amidase
MYRVGVDDGHGVETCGKRTPDGYKENEFNHYTKVYLIEALKRCGIEPIDCSPSRNDNSLADRCNIANRASCDVFVSVHYNAMGNNWNDGVGGIETYYWNNSIDGKRLATLIHNELMQGTPLKNRGVKSADFYVLRETNMIAALCECGFMDNHKEAELMKSENYRRECSEEICRGICKYLGVNYIPGQNQISNFVGAVYKRGIQGEQVKVIQQKINDYFNSLRIDIDGDFGPKTENAVKIYQQLKKLEVDGIVGPQTQKSLGM